MALSRLARSFNKTPTVENFKKLAQAKPAEAASWLENFGGSDKLPQRLVQGLQNTRWDQRLTPAEKLAKMEKLLGTHEASISRAITTAIKADEASPVDLGWSSVQTAPDVVKGRLQKSSTGELTLKTSKGNIAISASLDSQLATNDISTFLGSTVSIRGFFGTKSGGKGKTLTAMEWTVGQPRDFVCGRVEVSGNKVGIRVSSEKFVEVTHPEFKAQLKSFERTGFTFAGEVRQDGKRWVFEGPQPEEIHMLTSLGDPPSGANGQYTGAITPSPMSSSTPTTITGPRISTQGYQRRFIAGKIVTPGPSDGLSSFPARAFEMSKAWKTMSGSTAYSNDSGIEFSPVYDGAGQL